MSLSQELISQFVKVTNDKPKEVKADRITYGKVFEVKDGADGKQTVLVLLDGTLNGTGSDQCVPVETTVRVKKDDRVLVMIKNHTAVITGNLGSPAANSDYVDVKTSNVDEKATKAAEAANNATSKIQEFAGVITQKLDTEVFNAEIAKINDLETDTLLIRTVKANQANIESLQTDKLSASQADIKYATVDSLNATNAVVDNLKLASGDIGEFAAKLGEIESLTSDSILSQTVKANQASITSLQTEKLSSAEAALIYATVDSITGKFANIDFSNIGEAALRKIFSESGMISNLVVGDGTITGRLVGVTIVGDIIEGGTVKADKLVIKGSDGLYYKLNTNGVTTEAEQTDYNSLNGSVIKAKSITATKISVDDLVAFDATIGGFNITESSIYSGVKNAVDNTTKGIYLDKDGQMVIGDASNFIKYYKDQNGNYKLIISADSIIFATNNKSVETTITELEESLSVSGRNLLIRRGELLDTYVVSSGKVEPCDKAYRSATMLNPIKVEVGQPYTFSKDVSSLEYFRWAWYDENMNVMGRNAINASEFTWTIPQGTAYIWVSYPYTQGSNVKIEKGSSATGYSPALEDVGSSITELGTRITNVANDAKAEIDGLEIGGRNLIKNGSFVNGIDKWTPVGITYEINTDDKHGTYIKFASTVAGNSEHRLYPETNNNFNHSRGTFTLSFYARADAPCTLQTNIAGGTTGAKDYQLTKDWTKFIHTYDSTATGSLTFWLNSANTSACVTKIKLEHGDKPTDYTPAPEDMATSGEVTKAQSAADSARTIADEAKAILAQLSDSISMLVTDGNGTSLMTQTDDGWTFSTSEIQSAVNSVSEGLNNLSKEIGDTNSTVDILQQAVNDLGTIAEYVKIGTYEDEPCIELGEGDSDFKLRITNTRMMFTEGSNVLAYFNNQSLHIKKAVVEDELQQGGFVWKVRSNGNLGLIWKGRIE